MKNYAFTEHQVYILRNAVDVYSERVFDDEDPELVSQLQDIYHILCEPQQENLNTTKENFHFHPLCDY
jgi:hypothetical protein